MQKLSYLLNTSRLVFKLKTILIYKGKTKGKQKHNLERMRDKNIFLLICANYDRTISTVHIHHIICIIVEDKKEIC